MTQSAPIALNVALVSTALLGLRHGFDYDHIAAISDIAGVQRNPRRAMKMGLMYAIGHAATVALLGFAVILFQFSLPARIDAWVERAVGITLLVLGAYVLWGSIFQPAVPGHVHLPRSRMTILMNAVLWCIWRTRAAFSPRPLQPQRASGIGKAPAILVGIIHGLGAETPTQLMLFLLAANLGGFAKGLLGLGAFLTGMLVMNTVMCAAAAGLFRASTRRPRAFQWVAGVSAAYSVVVGVVFLAGITR